MSGIMLSTVGGGVVFVPNGGTITGSTVGNTVTTITCSIPAVWTYSVTSGGTAATANILSGTTASSITFTQGHTGNPPNRVGYTTSWSVTGSAGGVTANFTVTLTTTGDQ